MSPKEFIVEDFSSEIEESKIYPGHQLKLVFSQDGELLSPNSASFLGLKPTKKPMTA